MKNIVVYHDKCTDGLTAAAVFKYAHKKGLYAGDLEFLPYTIERGFPLSTLRTADADNIFMVDCAPPDVETMRELNKLDAGIIILDHHKSNIEMLQTCPELYDTHASKLNMSKSGAGIAWDYFFKDRIPMIDLVEDRDLWNYNIPGTKSFFFALGGIEPKIETMVELLEHEGLVNILKENGYHIEQYVNGRVTATCKTNTLHSTVSGYSCVIVNCTDNMSDVANQLLINHPEKQIGICYYHIPATNEFKVSMRSRKQDDVDVSKICATFEKGGGHKNAAACIMSPEVFNSTFQIGKHK